MKILILIALSILAFNTHSKENNALFNEISQMDKALFDAFNSCDLEAMSNIFSKELEFYHDKGGVANYEQTMSASKLNCDKKLGLTRTLIADTLKVFPIQNFGAIQEASHQFCHMENGKNDCGVFKFVHIWKKDGLDWKLFRVVSYDH
ncbi:nuclear transport factor 2 family protein [Thalassotalea fusca]